MKFTTTAALAAFAALASAAKDERTFAVLRFTNKFLTKGSVDPLVSPGKKASHAHQVMGGSNFGLSSTGEDLMKSQCSNAMIVGDNSNYWFPKVYFHDKSANKFEEVEVSYVNAYYFFEPTNDDIKAFPVGLGIFSGDPTLRTPPGKGVTMNLDPSKGALQPAAFTCPRAGGNTEANLPWPKNSDGTTAGMVNPLNLGEGLGFPTAQCDGLYSPMRADVHFPSCYNPEAGLLDYENNMAWPTDNKGKQDCPKGWIHVPHLFLEVYWDTPAFSDRWTPDGKTQPFVLSNGDATGYSSHADFMAGWDEEVLQNIIDNCNAGSAGMDLCPGVRINTEDCTIPNPITKDNTCTGTLRSLPDGNVLSGFSYGDAPSSPSNGGSSGGSSSASPAQPSSPSTYQPPKKPVVSEVPEAPKPSDAPKAPKPSATAPAQPPVIVKPETPETDQSASPIEAAPSSDAYKSPQPTTLPPAAGVGATTPGKNASKGKKPKKTKTCKSKTGKKLKRTKAKRSAVVNEEREAQQTEHVARHAHQHGVRGHSHGLH